MPERQSISLVNARDRERVLFMVSGGYQANSQVAVALPQDKHAGN